MTIRLKPIALAVGFVTLILSLVVRRYDQADAKLLVFYSQMLQADFSGAAESIDEAILLWPTNSRYYDWRGYATSQNLPPTCSRGLQGKQSGLGTKDAAAARAAIDDYLHALKLNREDAVAHANVAWLEHLLGNDQLAAKNWRAAVGIDPGNAIYHLSYGMFLEEVGNTPGARKQYETAIELSPSILDSQFFVRFSRRSNGAAGALVNELIEKSERQLQQGTDPITAAKLGKFYLFRGDYSRAEKFLEDASRQLPNLPLVWANLGEVYEKQGRLAEAIACYEKAKATSSSYLPYFHMGEIELRGGQRDLAADDLMQTVLRWQRAMPMTAAHNNRLYGGPRQRIDDFLPTTLVWYTTPCVASEAWKGLAQLYPAQRDYAQRDHVCEDLPSPHSGWAVPYVAGFEAPPR
ncbi:MAG: tetratricopeptide repeat protein [Candidatus Acidiferrales bacterium]